MMEEIGVLSTSLWANEDSYRNLSASEILPDASEALFLARREPSFMAFIGICFFQSVCKFVQNELELDDFNFESAQCAYREYTLCVQLSICLRDCVPLRSNSYIKFSIVG